MTMLRILSFLAWFGMAVFMASGAWAAATRRRERHGDAMRLACFATAFVVCGFNLRWLITPDSLFAWRLLHVLSIAVALYIIKLGLRYGRGPLRGANGER